MPDPINVFIIYAREDSEKMRRLLTHINPFIKPYDLIIWNDECLEAGQEWKPHIESRLEQTDLFMLLVSVDFMNSEFINQVEFKFAIERHKVKKSIVIPIIINYCQWDIDFYFTEYTFNLNELQVLPQQAMPIDDWKTPEQAYNNIAAGIRKVLDTLKNKRLAKLTEEEAIVKKGTIEKINNNEKSFEAISDDLMFEKIEKIFQIENLEERVAALEILEKKYGNHIIIMLGNIRILIDKKENLRAKKELKNILILYPEFCPCPLCLREFCFRDI